MMRTALIACVSLILTLRPSGTAGAVEVADVRDAVAASALAGLPDTVIRVEVRRLEIHGALPPEAAAIEVEAAGRTGRVRLSLTARGSDGEEVLLYLTADLVPWVEVPVLRRSVGKGRVVGADDAVARPRALADVPTGTISDLRALVGRSVRKDLQLGSLVRESDLTPRVDARRGRPVRVEVRGPGLVIRAEGVLREDAGIGDWASVSTRVGGVLRGRLVAADLVVIERSGS